MNFKEKESKEIMNKKSLLGFLITMLILNLVFVGCTNNQENAQSGDTSKEDAKLQKVTVILDWVPNTNHTGLYVAKAKGWYEENGLEVEIIQPTEGGSAQLIAAGQAEFGISYQEEVTYARSSQLPVVSIAAIIQHNTSGFASPKEKNIITPKDFEGKRYGGWGSEPEKAVIKTIMDKYDADMEKVEFVTVGSADFFTVTKKDVDFEWIYYGWTGIEAELRDFPINYISVKEIAPELDFYTPVIISNEEFINNNKDTVMKFIEATTKGYEFAIANPNDAATLLLEQIPELNEELVRESQKWLSEKYQEDASQWGIQKESIWEGYAQWMTEHQLIPEMIDSKSAFTNEFLPKR